MIASLAFMSSLLPWSVRLVPIGRAVGGGFRSWERHLSKEVRPPAARSDLSVPAATGAVPDGPPDGFRLVASVAFIAIAFTQLLW